MVVQNSLSTGEAAGSTLGKSGTVFITESGRCLDYLNPDPEQVAIADIMRSMSRQPRYLGHTTTVDNWTVADHLVLCVMVARLVHPGASPVFLAAVCAHDFHETYRGDFPTPLVRALEALGAGNAVREISARLDKAIYTKLGLPYPLPESWPGLIKEIDRISFRIEEAWFRPDPVEPGYLPEFWSGDLIRPLATDRGRMLRLIECWDTIRADWIKASPAIVVAPAPDRPSGSRVSVVSAGLSH